MITGQSYRDVAQAFSDRDLDTCGLYPRDLHLYLFARGYHLCERYRFEGSPKRIEQPWPIPPFAWAHLCEVRVVDSVGHNVVLMGDGSVLDPLTPDLKHLSDYLRVDSITGVSPFDARGRVA